MVAYADLLQEAGLLIEVSPPFGEQENETGPSHIFCEKE